MIGSSKVRKRPERSCHRWGPLEAGREKQGEKSALVLFTLHTRKIGSHLGKKEEEGGVSWCETRPAWGYSKNHSKRRGGGYSRLLSTYNSREEEGRHESAPVR